MATRTTLRGALAFSATLLLSATAHAQIFRGYLSSTGSDSNPCTLPQPCRLLPAALAAVADGGEIWMLDSANYNTATVTIGKSVSILAIPGAVGSVVATGGPAISITASSLNVALRNLVIVPFPSSAATNGVAMTGASLLTIENSLIANMPLTGVAVTGTGKVKIANSTIRNNTWHGVELFGGATAEISGAQLLSNGYVGVHVQSSGATTTTASVSDSVISGGVGGVAALTTIGGAVARVFVTRCTIGETNLALESFTSGGSAVVAVSSSMITNNDSAWSQTGAGSVIRTLGNNHITDNTTTSTGVLTPTPLQ